MTNEETPLSPQKKSPLERGIGRLLFTAFRRPSKPWDIEKPAPTNSSQTASQDTVPPDNLINLEEERWKRRRAS